MGTTREGSARLTFWPALPKASSARLDGSALLATCVLNVLGLALPLVTLHVYDKVLPNQSLETLAVMTIGLVVVALVEFALRSLQTAVLAPSAARYARDVKLEAIAGRLRGPVDDGNQARSATEEIERYTAVDRVAAFLGGSARQAMIDLPFAAVALGVIALIGGWLVVAPMIVLAVYILTLMSLGAALTEKTRERRDSDVKTADFLREAFTSIVTLKSLGLEALMTRRYERLVTGSGEVTESALQLTGDLQRYSSMFGGLCVAATLSCGAALAIAGEMTVGAVAATTLLAGRAVQPGVRAAKAWSEIERAAVAAEEVAKLFPGGAAAAASPIDEASFAARAAAPPAVALSAGARAPGGSIMWVRGGDAAARTAFIQGLAGLRSAAPARLDEQTPRDYRARYPQDVALVERDAAMFQGTILENIVAFGQDCSARDALAIGARLGLDDFARKLPNGYDTLVGVGVAQTVPASGVQAIALARAFAKRAKLILLDEPTVNLEPQQVAKLQDALRGVAGERTVVVASEGPPPQDLATHFVDLNRDPPAMRSAPVAPPPAPEADT